MSPRRRLGLAAALALFAPAAAIALAPQLVAAPTFTWPQTPGAVLSVASPTALAATPTAGFTAGAIANVANQGAWTYAPTCPQSCDGSNTCVTAAGADGGLGCWVRGTSGVPGAQLAVNWYATSPGGSDSADCQTSGTACLTIQEVLRRIAQQPIPGTPYLFLSGPGFAGFNGILDMRGAAYPYSNGQQNGLTIQGSRTYTGADGGALFAGTVSAYTQWDAGIDGIVTIAPIDGGPAFSTVTFNSAGGYILEDTSSCNTDGISCESIIIGPSVGDAGTATFATPGGAQLFGFTSRQPTVGNTVRVAQLTPVGTASGAVVQIDGTGGFLANVWMGNAPHSVQFSTHPGTPHATGMDTCIVAGADVYSEVDVWGGAFVGGTRVIGGQLESFWSYYDYAEARSGGLIYLDKNNLIGFQGLINGGETLGVGSIYVAGVTAVEGYSSPCLMVADGARVTLAAPFICHNATATSVPAIKVFSAGAVLYPSGQAPVVNGLVGTAPWIVGGTPSDAGPPIVNATNGAEIVVNQ